VTDCVVPVKNAGAIRSPQFIAGLDPGQEQISVKGNQTKLIVTGSFYEDVTQKFDVEVIKTRGELVQGPSTLYRWGGETSTFGAAGNMDAAADTVYEALETTYEFVDVTDTTPHNETSYHFGTRTVDRTGVEHRDIYGSENLRTYGASKGTTYGNTVSNTQGLQHLSNDGVTAIESIFGANLLAASPIHVQCRISPELNFSTISQVIAAQEALLSLFNLDAWLLKGGQALVRLENHGAVGRFFAGCIRYFGLGLGAVRIP
jgi:hypothetical protein